MSPQSASGSPVSPDAPSQGAQRAASQWTEDDRREWIELSYDAGLESLKAQREELSGIRQRAIMFTAFTLTATGFLVGTGLGDPGDGRTAAFYTFAIVGTVLFGLLAVLLVGLVAPFISFKFVLMPDVLMRWLEGSQPAPSRLIALRQLTTQTVPDMLKFNAERLRVVRGLYRGVLITAVLTLACWVTVVWVFA